MTRHTVGEGIQAVEMSGTPAALNHTIWICLVKPLPTWRVKKDVSEPTLYAIILGALLLVRLIAYLRSRLAMPDHLMLRDPRRNLITLEESKTL